MRTLVLALALAGAATCAGAQDSELPGTWVATEAVRDGAPAPDLVGHRLTFADDLFQIVDASGDLVYAGTYQVDPAAEPLTIDFANTEGDAVDVTWSGIWRVVDDTLTIVDNAPDPDQPRPSAFEAPAGSGYVLLSFTRDD
jgi:uncharacterized protein (TIGR03067 family)